jgi:hypothetical protein
MTERGNLFALSREFKAMKHEMIHGVLALLLLQAPAPNSKAVVEGLVVRADTAEALAGAQITLSVSDATDDFIRAMSNAEGDSRSRILTLERIGCSQHEMDSRARNTGNARRTEAVPPSPSLLAKP